jgi:cobalt transporter subunit CbtB
MSSVTFRAASQGADCGEGDARRRSSVKTFSVNGGATSGRKQSMQIATIVYPDIRIGQATRHWPAIAVLVFGFALLYCVGFTTMARVHNAAHDTRHASGFPCH